MSQKLSRYSERCQASFKRNSPFSFRAGDVLTESSMEIKT